MERLSCFAWKTVWRPLSKYNVGSADKRTYDGIVFDSVVEMRYYKEVVLPGVASGKIVNYKLQKPFMLIPKFTRDGKTVRSIQYVCDFYLEYADGHTEVIDVKGMATSEAKMKRKMFLYFYPDMDLKWVVYVKKYGGWIEYDEYQKLKKGKRGA